MVPWGSPNKGWGATDPKLEADIYAAFGVPLRRTSPPKIADGPRSAAQLELARLRAEWDRIQKLALDTEKDEVSPSNIKYEESDGPTEKVSGNFFLSLF